MKLHDSVDVLLLPNEVYLEGEYTTITPQQHEVLHGGGTGAASSGKIQASKRDDAMQ